MCTGISSYMALGECRKRVFSRKSLEQAKRGSGTFYQTCASCLQQDVSWLTDRNEGPVALPKVARLQYFSFLFMGTFKTLMHSIHLQLKMKTAFNTTLSIKIKNLSFRNIRITRIFFLLMWLTGSWTLSKHIRKVLLTSPFPKVTVHF